jgi:AcrR family transcriptional regulator
MFQTNVCNREEPVDTSIAKSSITEPDGLTKARLLDVAERLFADHGVDGTSLRQITKEAETNLAAVNYYFSSKDGLIAAVFARRLEPLSVEQSALLDAVEQGAGEQPARLEDVLRAIIQPAVIGEGSLHKGHEPFRRLMGRVFTEPGSQLQLLVKNQFEKVSQRFDRLLTRSLPQLSPEEVFWRRQFLVGALHRVLLISDKPESYAAPGLHPSFEPHRMVEQLVDFAAAGFRLPPSAENQKRGNP